MTRRIFGVLHSKDPVSLNHIKCAITGIEMVFFLHCFVWSRWKIEKERTSVQFAGWWMNIEGHLQFRGKGTIDKRIISLHTQKKLVSCYNQVLVWFWDKQKISSLTNFQFTERTFSCQSKLCPTYSIKVRSVSSGNESFPCLKINPKLGSNNKLLFACRPPG